MKLLVALLLLAPCGSAPAPEPAPTPPPIPAPGPAPSAHDAGVVKAPCELACDHMVKLGCVAAATPGGRACADVFCVTDVGWNYACMQRASDCDALDRCNP